MLWGLGFSSRGVKTQGVTWVHQLCSLLFSLIVLMDLAVTTPVAFTGDPGCIAGGGSAWTLFSYSFLLLVPRQGPYGALMGSTLLHTKMDKF